jgi:hypothetical protein
MIDASNVSEFSKWHDMVNRVRFLLFLFDAAALATIAIALTGLASLSIPVWPAITTVSAFPERILFANQTIGCAFTRAKTSNAFFPRLYMKDLSAMLTCKVLSIHSLRRARTFHAAVLRIRPAFFKGVFLSAMRASSLKERFACLTRALNTFFAAIHLAWVLRCHKFFAAPFTDFFNGHQKVSCFETVGCSCLGNATPKQETEQLYQCQFQPSM